jgi:3-deoxy-manno-octulosonate cytidylyltransferase (CMP-KDO synthetase)
LTVSIVIPARYNSSRFPGKPLALVKGITLLERVWRISQAAVTHVKDSAKLEVVVATDDERIARHVEGFGGTVVMTSSACRNGTERVYEAVSSSSSLPEIIVNIQGDAPLISPHFVAGIINAMRSDAEVQVATPAVRLSKESYDRMLQSKGAGIVSGTTVTFDKKGDALYFSKAVIPFMRSEPQTMDGTVPVFQHIGMYAYTMSALKRLIELPEGEFEKVESLEQLRALEHGIPVRVVQVSLGSRTLWPIDTPEDVKRVEEIIEREGELV